MLAPLRHIGKWLHTAVRHSQPTRSQPLSASNLLTLAEAELPAPIRACPVALKYHRLLHELDWQHFPERDPRRAWPGPAPAYPRAAFVAAYLVKLDQQQRYMSDLRAYLVEHPALARVLGFDPAQLPSRKQFGRVLRQLPNAALQFLLDAAVRAIVDSLPPQLRASFGDTVAIDTKHILAWVKENNPKVFVKGRYDKTRQPQGDPDCKLGVKSRANTPPETEMPTPTTDAQPASQQVGDTEAYWGYASGVCATKLVDAEGAPVAEVVLAEHTQTFDRDDVTYFHPLIAATQRRLGRAPRYGALDKAFDAFYVYEDFHDAGGFAAVPYVPKGAHPKREFDAGGLPLCQAGLGMPLKLTYQDRSHHVPHQKGRYACPLLHPTPRGEVCPIAHPKWSDGGCTTSLATSIGARLRYQLDRDSDAFKAIYQQRTADERINSQAVALGIERPKLRNQRSITNAHTLTYVLINLRALRRVRAHYSTRASEVAQPLS